MTNCIGKLSAGQILLAELRSAGLPQPTAEHHFHPMRRWRLDYAWADRLVAVEIHGGVYIGGRHVRGVGFERDREKMNSAQILGWTVLEYSTGQVLSGLAITQLREALT